MQSFLTLGLQRRIVALILYSLALLVVWPSAIRAETYHVAEVINGKSLRLNKGKILRLASIQVPNVAEQSGLKRPGEPMGEECKAELERLTQGKSLELVFGAEKQDRKGRWVAVATLAEGQSVQAALLGKGCAIVYPFPDRTSMLEEWLELEKRARQAQKGLWKVSYWRPITAERFAQQSSVVERYRLVEGTVKDVAEVRGKWFLNFGADWKQDFTGVISKDDATRFDTAWLQSLKGKTLRLRGWIYAYNGPAIDLHQPEQIEVLE